MSMRWSLYPGATYGYGSPQGVGVRSGYVGAAACLELRLGRVDQVTIRV